MTYRPTESESDAITVVGVVIVGVAVAVAVDITEIIAVARIRRTLPPVVSGATTAAQKPTEHNKTRLDLRVT